MKKGSILALTLLFFFCTLLGSAFAEGTAAEKVARELLEVSGVGKMGSQVTDRLIKLRKKSLPDLPEQFWEDFTKEVSPEELNKKIVPVYVKHFTIEEMKAIIAFYKTDAGQKYLSKLPDITKESMEAGRKWNKELLMKLTKKLKTADFKSMKK